MFYITFVDFTMKRSSTVPDSQFKAAAAEEESRGGLSMINSMLSGKIFGSYLPTENKPEEFTYRNRQRRNSKSLPASPLSSPKIYRKNPYFTDPFARPDETFEPGRTGLILSILSQRKSLEDLVGKTNVTNSAAAIADTNRKSSETNAPQIPRHTQKYYEPIPKPSELREMNFWSPVSM